jgi:hypothetical protein
VLAAAAVLALAIFGRVSGAMDFRAYPTLSAPLPAAQFLIAASIAACGLAPFLQRRGITR